MVFTQTLLPRLFEAMQQIYSMWFMVGEDNHAIQVYKLNHDRVLIPYLHLDHVFTASTQHDGRKML